MKKKIFGIIPARYGSTRFPGKPLALIAGKSMIQRVYEQAGKSKLLTDLLVATDDRRIADHVEGFGGKVVMTSAHHLSGTDRLAEVMKKLKGVKPFGVLNIQGDEPFIDPKQIDQLVKLLAEKDTAIATLVMPMSNKEDINNPSVVKVVFNAGREAMYFSRSPIPYIRDAKAAVTGSYFRHIGLYAYRTSILLKIAKLKPGKLEKAESLEQLRWLENGFSIKVGISHHLSISVDTPEDLEKVNRMSLKAL